MGTIAFREFAARHPVWGAVGSVLAAIGVLVAGVCFVLVTLICVICVMIPWYLIQSVITLAYRLRSGKEGPPWVLAVNDFLESWFEAAVGIE